MIDYLIVGAGMFGSVFARQMTDAGYKCKVIDKRSHIGGNCYTENIGGINVHKYGAHIFHTNNNKVWEYANKHAEFNGYRHHLKTTAEGRVYSFPINMMTLSQMWGVCTPEQAEHQLKQKKIKIVEPGNLEEWILSQVGEEIYEKFIKGYTTKQWGRHPTELPASIIQRLPIRLTYNDGYFSDKYQGIPIGGYTAMFKKLLKKIPVQLGVDYLKDKDALDRTAKKVVYTGALDEFFDYEYGELEWRSLRFSEEMHTGDYQGVSVMNYADENIPHTRIIEHKHFEQRECDNTVITMEYPQEWSRGLPKIYPVNDEKNTSLYNKYKKAVDKDKYILGGRLATYRYYDMHQVMGASLKMSRQI